jgi:Ubiquitin carboxyl-terminal hydrolases
VSFLCSEKEKRELGRIENARRRHNFVPFVVELLTQLANKGQLMKALEDGRKRYHAQQERARAEAAAAKKLASASSASSASSSVPPTVS